MPNLQGLPGLLAFAPGVGLRLPVEALRPVLARDGEASLPKPVRTLADRALAAGPLLSRHAQSSLRFFSRSANASTLSGSYSHPAAVFTALSRRASARSITPCLLRPSFFDTCPVDNHRSNSLRLTNIILSLSMIILRCNLIVVKNNSKMMVLIKKRPRRGGNLPRPGPRGGPLDQSKFSVFRARVSGAN